MNCPNEINIYFFTTHHLNLRIGSENKKSSYSKDCPHEIHMIVLLYNSPTKFENSIGEQKKKREWLL